MAASSKSVSLGLRRAHEGRRRRGCVSSEMTRRANKMLPLGFILVVQGQVCAWWNDCKTRNTRVVAGAAGKRWQPRLHCCIDCIASTLPQPPVSRSVLASCGKQDSRVKCIAGCGGNIRVPSVRLLRSTTQAHGGAASALVRARDVAALVEDDVDAGGVVIHGRHAARGQHAHGAAGLLERGNGALRVSEGAAEEIRKGGATQTSRFVARTVY